MGGSKINKYNKIIIFLLTIVIVATAVMYGDNNTYTFSAEKLYSSKNYVQDVNQLLYEYANKYPSFITVEKVGDTYIGNEMIALKIGKGEKKIFINASHHGKEHMTTLLVMNQIDYLVNKYQYDVELRALLNEVSIVFLPMVNPDGIAISRGNLKPVMDNTIAASKPFRSIRSLAWKANGRGVDINRNYPMRWNYILNDPGKPAERNYKGENPFSEVETKAVEELCKKYNFELVLSYHAAGELIFWYAYQNAEAEKLDLAIAKDMSKITSYKVDMVRNTAGGMKDWFVQEYKKPGFTIEIGSSKYVGDSVQLPYSEYRKIWLANRDIPEYLLKYVRKQI